MLQELATEKPEARTNSSVKHRSKLATHYEALFDRIRYAAAPGADCPTIGITSCASRAGVSTVALNVAVTAANAGEGPVLVIDADIHEPAGPNAVGNVPALGLVDAITGTAAPLECVTPSAHENVSVLAGRGIRPHRATTIEPGKFAELLNEYKQHYKLVVVDIPTPTDLNGFSGMAEKLDGVVLVLEAEKADGRAAVRLKQQLSDAGVNLLGVVLNKRRQYVPGWLYRLL